MRRKSLILSSCIFIIAAFSGLFPNQSRYFSAMPALGADSQEQPFPNPPCRKGEASVDGPMILISNCRELQKMKNNLADDYVLTKDIECSDTRNWNEGKGFEPIGTYPELFTGSLDGRGYKIINLYINRPDTTYVGLFGAVRGEIKNVGLVDVKIIGGLFVGGLVGFHEGQITNSYSTGNVTGNHGVGGLVGYNFASHPIRTIRTISNSYSTASVGAAGAVGGLAGENDCAAIINSYSTGDVNATTTDSSGGGLVGWNYFQTISNSYYYDSAGNPNVCGATNEPCTPTATIDCTAISEEAYFYIISNPPMDEWDFENTWSDVNHGLGYPELKRKNAEKFIRGDANSDSEIDVADAVKILEYLYKDDTLKCLSSADANDDGAIDISDAVYVLSYLFTGGNAPPAPFPNPGFDQTEDELWRR